MNYNFIDNKFHEGKTTVLALGPHVDDIEIGCGATIAKFVERGYDIFWIIFSLCESSLPENCDIGTIEGELYNSASKIGVPADNIIIHNYPVRHHQENRQKILDDLILARKDLNPDVIFLPSKNDIHQDHQTIHSEGIRAFKGRNIFGYEMIWNSFSNNLSTFSVIDDGHLDLKIKALNCYNSQKDRLYFNDDIFYSLAKTRGIQIGKKFAEAFETYNLIIQ